MKVYFDLPPMGVTKTTVRVPSRLLEKGAQVSGTNAQGTGILLAGDRACLKFLCRRPGVLCDNRG